ncbi:histidine phosphatase superfamily [Chaetomium sp. MPI-SDFR-AT-0129]|nr:histidine phosphatase superfamily [Chaetomium sp. MPI-SDFR-AT-0129]
MPTYIHFVRHAQGLHNLTAANHVLPDPDLTPLGREQCAALAASFPHQHLITHLVASPLRRTLYTCLLSFEPALARLPAETTKVVAVPELQEISPWACDTGSDRGVLEGEFGPTAKAAGEGQERAKQVDLGLVVDGWNEKLSLDSPWAPVMERLEARARTARVWLRELGREFEKKNPGVDAHVAVVTHGGILHFLTQDYDGMDPQTGTGWTNTEWRTYQFANPEETDGEAKLKETADSWSRRRGSTTALTETEQLELRVVVKYHLVKEWGENGEKATLTK